MKHLILAVVLAASVVGFGAPMATAGSACKSGTVTVSYIGGSSASVQACPSATVTIHRFRPDRVHVITRIVDGAAAVWVQPRGRVVISYAGGRCSVRYQAELVPMLRCVLG